MVLFFMLITLIHNGEKINDSPQRAIVLYFLPPRYFIAIGVYRARFLKSTQNSTILLHSTQFIF